MVQHVEREQGKVAESWTWDEKTVDKAKVNKAWWKVIADYRCIGISSRRAVVEQFLQ